MNNISISGGTQSQRNKVQSMIEFCIEKLMPRMQTLDIEVNLKKINNAMGYCLCMDNRTFELEIGTNQRLRRIMETVAHEMVHVKQYARGELKPDYKWRDKTINPERVEYWDLPWEIEAHGREVGLFVRWVQSTGQKGKWTEDL
jgi:hypothetical protein